MKRHFWTFKHVLRMAYDTYWFIEGDSICTGKAPTKPTNGVHCFAWDNNDPKFKAKQYLHWALGMNRQTLVRLAKASDAYNPAQEAGFPDRLIGLICQENGIEIKHRPDVSYSRNAIDREEYFQQAHQAIANGATFVHGIKHDWQLSTLFS